MQAEAPNPTETLLSEIPFCVDVAIPSSAIDESRVANFGFGEERSVNRFWLIPNSYNLFVFLWVNVCP